MITFFDKWFWPTQMTNAAPLFFVDRGAIHRRKILSFSYDKNVRRTSDYMTYYRQVCNQRRTFPFEATWLECDFVLRVTESEFYLQRCMSA